MDENRDTGCHLAKLRHIPWRRLLVRVAIFLGIFCGTVALLFGIRHVLRLLGADTGDRLLPRVVFYGLLLLALLAYATYKHLTEKKDEPLESEEGRRWYDGFQVQILLLVLLYAGGVALLYGIYFLLEGHLATVGVLRIGWLAVKYGLVPLAAAFLWLRGIYRKRRKKD